MANIRGTKGADAHLNGTSGDDVILALGGKDNIDGGDGSDVIVAGPGGNDTIDGGVDAASDDTDTLVLNGSWSSYSAQFDQFSHIVLTQAGGPVETVIRIENVAFDDQNVLVVGAGSNYTTIQSAIDAAQDGDIILVAGGTYQEQLQVDGKTNLTIMALAGDHVTIQAPDDVSQTATSSAGVGVEAVVTIANSTNIVFQNVDVDGHGRGGTVTSGDDFTGVIYRNSSGSLVDVDITGVRDEPLDGVQRGVGLRVDNDGTYLGLDFTMTGGSISDFQKNAARINGAHIDISGVHVTGAGDTAILAQNGF